MSKPNVPKRNMKLIVMACNNAQDEKSTWAIGKKGQLPFNGIKEDLKRFKKITTTPYLKSDDGKSYKMNALIFGRKSYEALPHRPLPGRRNIVLSRNPDYHPKAAANLTVYHSLEELMQDPDFGQANCFVAGGAKVYRLLENYCNEAYVTLVDFHLSEADAIIPSLEYSRDWACTYSSGTFSFIPKCKADDDNPQDIPINYSFKHYIRK